jgi:hypothetical protein
MAANSRFLARLASQGSASDFARNDKGLPRSYFLLAEEPLRRYCY